MDFRRNLEKEDDDAVVSILVPAPLLHQIFEYLIAILGVCWIGLIVFFIIYKHKALAPTTIGGILLFVQILVQRKRDLDKIAEKN